MNSTRTSSPDPLPTTFAALHALRRLRPICDAADQEEAFKLLDRLMVTRGLTADQQDYLLTLATLLGVYEREQRRLMAGSPAKALADLCRQHNLGASDLGEILGNRSLGSKLLRGERLPSKAHIRVLRKRFGVSADAFI